MKWGLKGGISIDADSGPPRYVLWCCGGICHQVLTFFQIGCGHTVICMIFSTKLEAPKLFSLCFPTTYYSPQMCKNSSFLWNTSSRRQTGCWSWKEFRSFVHIVVKWASIINFHYLAKLAKRIVGSSKFPYIRIFSVISYNIKKNKAVCFS